MGLAVGVRENVLWPYGRNGTCAGAKSMCALSRFVEVDPIFRATTAGITAYAAVASCFSATASRGVTFAWAADTATRRCWIR